MLVPLFFNIFMCNLFFRAAKIDFASYTDDNIPLVSGDRLLDFLDYLGKASAKRFVCFSNNQMRQILKSVIYPRVLLLP